MAPMAATSRPKKTIDDFMALGDEVRAELIAGELYMTPAPSAWHQDVAANLLQALRPFVRQHRMGNVWTAPLDVHLPSADIVQPDLIFVRIEKRDIVRSWIHGAPDLLVEIVSPSNAERDRLVKRTLYEQNGVPEYWIVDADVCAVEVLRLDKDSYVPAGWFASDTTLVSAELPGLQLDIDEVFRPAF